MRLPMLKNSVPLFLSLALLASPLAGQDQPPPYLQIFREEIKVGRVAHHAVNEAAWMAAYMRAGTKNYSIAVTTKFGPTEAWWLEGARSLEEIEQMDRTIAATPGLSAQVAKFAEADAMDVSATRTILARLLPDLSNPGPMDHAMIRGFEVTIFRIRPGHEADFAEAARVYRSVAEGANIQAPWATYEVRAGMPGTAFLVFMPFQSLAELDPATGAMEALQKAMTTEMMKRVTGLSEGFESVETLVMNVSPEISYPPPDYATRNPAFWGKKPMAPARVAPPRPNP